VVTGGRGERGWGDDGPSDSALIAAVGAVDDQSREALGEIYRRHGAAVWSVAQRVCHRDELAEAVCETVFAELWSHPERFVPARGSLRSWLVAQAHRRAVAVARSEQDRRRQERSTPPSAEVEVAAHAETLNEDARRAIDRLAAVERDSILLTYVGGHSCSEAARLLGVPEATVKSSVRRGLLNLRQTLEAEGVSR
jgi:RNA polymerase sigma-70 factor (ECF subfamily)